MPHSPVVIFPSLHWLYYSTADPVPDSRGIFEDRAVVVVLARGSTQNTLQNTLVPVAEA